MTWFDRLKFWKPKAERLAAKRPTVPQKPKIDVFGGLRLLDRLGRSLWGRRGKAGVRSTIREAEDYYYGGTCHSDRRRPGTRPAIRPSDRQRELKVSRRPAKPIPRIVEKRYDPVTDTWVRPPRPNEITHVEQVPCEAAAAD